MTRMSVAVGWIVAASAALGGTAGAQENVRVQMDGRRSITVQGAATTSVVPDVATLTVGTESRGPTADEALAANNKAMAALMDLLKRRGIEARDVQTSGLSLSPLYDRPVKDRAEDDPARPAPRIVGYVVHNAVGITARDVAKVGGLLDATVKAGVNKIERLSFRVSDPHPALRDLRKKAIADARAKAEEVAREAGMELGLPISITVDYSPTQYAFEARSNVVGRYESAVPIAAGVEDLSATVGVVYELKAPR